MPRALWKGKVIAESDTYETVEGNIYFPPGSVRDEHLKPSPTHTVCGWKGTASYYNVVVDGDENRDAAWYYPDPKPDAANIKDHVAFWRGVTVER
ncbi:MAG TPA: DUF427 domain-containing protein [Thermoanaerobaculia bacterium]|jgi:uncharacterized protein (DUF427 family)|nr:DUF427 domain-containing protein [Thermoanaerobaculia bacterium]